MYMNHPVLMYLTPGFLNSAKQIMRLELLAFVMEQGIRRAADKVE